MKFLELYDACQQNDVQTVELLLTPAHDANFLFQSLFLNYSETKNSIITWFFQQPWFDEKVNAPYIVQHCNFKVIRLYLQTMVQRKDMESERKQAFLFQSWYLLFFKPISIPETKQLLQDLQTKELPIHFFPLSEKKITFEKKNWLLSSTNSSLLFCWDQELVSPPLKQLATICFQHSFISDIETQTNTFESVLKTNTAEENATLFSQNTSVDRFRIIYNYFDKQWLLGTLLQCIIPAKTFTTFWDVCPALHSSLIFNVDYSKNCVQFRVLRPSPKECNHEQLLLSYLESTIQQFADTRWAISWKPSNITKKESSIQVVSYQPDTDQYILAPYVQCCINIPMDKQKKIKQFLSSIVFFADPGLPPLECNANHLSFNTLDSFQWAIRNHFIVPVDFLGQVFEHHCFAKKKSDAIFALWILPFLSKKDKKRMQKGFVSSLCSKHGFPLAIEMIKQMPWLAKVLSNLLSEPSIYINRTIAEFQMLITFVKLPPKILLINSICAGNLEIARFIQTEDEPILLTRNDCKRFIYSILTIQMVGSSKKSKKSHSMYQQCLDWIFPTFCHIFCTLWSDKILDFAQETGQRDPEEDENETFGERCLFYLVLGNFPTTVIWLITHQPSIRPYLFRLDATYPFVTALKAEISASCWTTSTLLNEACNVCYEKKDELKHASCQHLYCSNCIPVLKDTCPVCFKSFYSL